MTLLSSTIPTLDPPITIRVTVTNGSMAALPAHACRAVELIAKDDNSDPNGIIIGDSAVTLSTGDVMRPGTTRERTVNNTSLIYAGANSAGQILIVTYQP